MSVDSELDPDVAHVQRGVTRFVRWGLDAQTAARCWERVTAIGDGPQGTAAVAVWVEAGQRFEEAATVAAQRGDLVTARSWWRQAFWCYRVGDFSCPKNAGEKVDAYRRSLDMFGRVAHDVTQTTVSAEGVEYRAIIVPGADDPSVASDAGAVLIYGADGNKEEHYWASAGSLARRGVTVIVVDGPGQGHAIREDGVGARPDYGPVASAAIDRLIAEPGVDAQRIGLIGSSMGGYYAPRVFAADERFRALVLNSALFDVNSLWDYYPPIRRQLTYNLLGDGDAALPAQAYDDFTLDGVTPPTERSERPALILHGSDDIYIPSSQAQQVANLLGDCCQLEVWEGGGHNMSQVGIRALPPAWDWLRRSLLNGNDQQLYFRGW